MGYTIYLRTNLVTGKQYVGQTENFKHRESCWKCLKYTYANQYIDNDRKEYGVENFKVEVIDHCETQEEAYELEEYYIKEYDTKYPNGYNLTEGGAGIKGFKHSEESRKKMSEALKGKHSSPDTEFKKGQTPWNKDKSGCFLEESRKKMSESHKGNTPWNKGIPLTEEHKSKISMINKGKHLSESTEFPKRKVNQYDKDENFIKRWDSLADIKRELGYSHGNIIRCCKGKSKQSYGYIWKYAEE